MSGTHQFICELTVYQVRKSWLKKANRTSTANHQKSDNLALSLLSHRLPDQRQRLADLFADPEKLSSRLAYESSINGFMLPALGRFDRYFLAA